MSVSMWAYRPEECDGNPCVGDCDLCSKWQDFEEFDDGEDVDGMYECFHCCTRSVVWDCDFNFDDFGYEGDGIVQICHCTNCGAEIEYRIPLGEETEDERD